MSRILLMLSLAIPAIGWGQVIPDRVSLDNLLGGTGTLVDFETYSFTTAPSENAFGIAVLNSSTIVNAQGPGLVPAGVTFSTVGGFNLQWSNAGYFGAPSREIDFFSDGIGPSTIDMVFAAPALAFGIDLRGFAGFPNTASATIYAPDLTTVLAVVNGISIPGSGSPIFFGYQSAGGIGKVSLAQSSQYWSPLVDNLRFSAIPEPPMIQLVTVGLSLLLARRGWRRIRAGSQGNPSDG